MPKFSVYCDGSSGGNSTGPIGWGWVVIQDDRHILSSGSGGHISGTNNIAELMAAREGLRSLLQQPAFLEGEPPQEVELVSDSQYVLGLANGSYSAVKNVPLARHLNEICQQYAVRTRWVEGHSGDPLNEICDKLAKRGKEQFLPPKLTKRHIRRARKRKYRK